MYVHQIQRSALYLIFSVCGLFYNSLAQATSFNCLSPNLKKFEEMICFNQTLSVLDEQVNSYYEDALKVAPDPKKLRESQKIDMARRKDCKTADCIQGQYDSTLKHLKEFSIRPYISFNPDEPAYPIWISPLLTDPELKTKCNSWDINNAGNKPRDIICRAYRIMHNAKPAYQSAVNNFVFTKNSVEVLPGLLRYPRTSTNEQIGALICDQYVFNHNRIPMNQNNRYEVTSPQWDVIKSKTPKKDEWTLKVNVLNDKQLSIRREEKDDLKSVQEFDIQILGRGELLDNGWESLLVQVVKTFPMEDNAKKEVELFILKRKSPTAVFQAANPEQYLATRSGDGSVIWLWP
jgi:uncharacterized protein